MLKKGDKVEIICESPLKGCTAKVVGELPNGCLQLEILDAPVDHETGKKKLLKFTQGNSEGALETTVLKPEEISGQKTSAQSHELKVLALLLVAGAAAALDWLLGLGGSTLGVVPAAVSIANVYVNNNGRCDDVTATADGDTTATIPHGFGPGVPQDVQLVGLQAAAQLSLPVASTIDATNVVVTMTAAVGSGAAGAQVRVYTKRRGAEAI